MKRVIPSERCNTSPDARYHRTLNEAFPCDAKSAVAFFPPEKRRAGLAEWLCWALIAAMACVALWLFNLEPVAADHKHQAAQKACGQGKQPVWLDSTTVQCMRIL